ncbi:PKD domain-containing protein [Roseivirga sp. BDSF3-8]|uniref:PKD domain-containing protein n=1 Tax=Roseivirga sp. BDSF3-8 TaxID=3241598 RepID=UPI0035325DA3
MRKGVFYLIYTVFILLIPGVTMAQLDCNSVFSVGLQGSINHTATTCAPVLGDIEVFFGVKSTALADPAFDPNRIEIEIRWNDEFNTVQRYPAAPHPTLPNYYVVREQFVYAAGSMCTYTPEAYPVYDGVACDGGSIRQVQPLISYGQDNEMGGVVELAPNVHEVCVGNPFTVTFADATFMNCNRSVEAVSPNEDTRWIRFRYGSNLTGDANRIPNMYVDGVQVTDATGALIMGEYADPRGVITMPAPVTGPNEITLPISMPASGAENVGDIFVITIENWNVCNPFPNGEAPVEAIGIVEIVDTPPLDRIYAARSNDVEATTFCPGEDVRFIAANQSNLRNRGYSFDWEIFDMSSGSEVSIWTQNDDDPKETRFGSFSTPGPKRIRLTLSNPSIAVGSCVIVDEVDINVIEAVQARVGTNDAENGYQVSPGVLEFCYDGTTPISVDFSDQSSNPGGNSYTKRWRLTERNSAVDSLSWTGSDPPTIQFDKYGKYAMRLRTTDNITGCQTNDYVDVYIYPHPETSFTVQTPVCTGDSVKIIPVSTLPANVNGDALSLFEWDFSYDGVTFTPDPDPKYTTTSEPDSVKYLFPGPGNYEVAYRVSSQKSCPTVISNTVVVNKLPTAGMSLIDSAGCPIKRVTYEIDVTQPSGVTIDEYYLVTEDIENGDIKERLVDQTAADFPRFTYDYSNFSTTDKHYYRSYLKVVSTEGCEDYTSPVDIIVNPGALGEFTSNYDLSRDYCSGETFDYQATSSTLSLNPDRIIWYVEDAAGNNVTTPVVQTDPLASDWGQFSYTFLNNTNVRENFTVIMMPEKAGTCISPDQELVKIYPAPQSGFTATPIVSSCNLVRVEFEATQKSMADYRWDIDGIIYQSALYRERFSLDFPRPTSTDPDKTIDIKLITTNANGCESVETIDNIVINKQSAPFTVDYTFDNSTGCAPVTRTITNTTSGAPAGTVFELVVSYGLNVDRINLPAGDFVDFVFDEEGQQYIFEIEAITPEGCDFSSAQESFRPAVNAVAEFDLANETGCAPMEVVVEPNWANATSIQWTFTDLSDNSEFFTTTDAGFRKITLPNTSTVVKAYEVKLEAFTAEGCSDVKTLQVDVSPEPRGDFNILTPMPACDPYHIEVENLGIKNNLNPPGTVYTWFFEGVDQSSVAAPETLVFTNSSYFSNRVRNLTLRIETPNGCIKEVTKQVTLAPQILANFELVPEESCSDVSIAITDYTLGAQTNEWYIREVGNPTWQPLDIAELERDGVSNDSNVDMEFQIRLVASSANGCTSEAVRTLTVYPKVTADFDIEGTPGCSPVDMIFKNRDIRPNVDYLWKWNDGTGVEEVNNNPDVPHQFVNAAATGEKKYTVTLEATHTVTGCKAIMSKVVTVYPTITLRVEPDVTTGCAPLDVNFFPNNSTGVSGSHFWMIRNKSAGETNYTTVSNNQTFSYTFNNTTTEMIVFEVRYEAESQYGCQKSKVWDIFVYPDMSAAFDATPERQVLPDATVTVTNQSSAGDWDYLWEWGDGATSTDTDPVPHTYAGYGVYEIKLTLKNDGGCVSEYSRQVTIEPVLPIVDFVGTPRSGCAPLTVEFTNQTKFAREDTYFWEFGDNLGTSTVKNPVYTYTQPGIYSVRLTASNDLGVDVEEVKESYIEVYENPRASFNVRPRTVYLPDMPVYTVNLSYKADQYIWDFGDGTTYEDYEPVHTYATPGVYDIKLIAIGADGCTDTLLIEKAINAVEGGEVRIPNAFTPNLDGPIGGEVPGGGAVVNDVFLPLMEGVTEFNMQIFNRWGELLFESEDKNVGWDGYYKGQLCAPDVYVYKLTFRYINGEQVTRVGDVTLVR